MDYETVRRLVQQALREQAPTQWVSLCDRVGRLAYDQKLVTAGSGANGRVVERAARSALSAQDQEYLREVFWDLVSQGIICLGLNKDNEFWPFFKVTTYGQTVLEAGEAIPYDPEGYLRRVKQTAPDLSAVAEYYLAESVQCFIRGLYTASAVMLGAASEALFMDLTEAIAQAISDSSKKDKFLSAATSVSIRRAYDAVSEFVQGVKSGLPDDLRRDCDVFLTGIFNIIRMYRNEAGHPSGRRILREEAFANLQVFVAYCRHMHSLAQHFRATVSGESAGKDTSK